MTAKATTQATAETTKQTVKMSTSKTAKNEAKPIEEAIIEMPGSDATNAEVVITENETILDCVVESVDYVASGNEVATETEAANEIAIDSVTEHVAAPVVETVIEIPAEQAEEPATEASENNTLDEKSSKEYVPAEQEGLDNKAETLTAGVVEVISTDAQSKKASKAKRKDITYVALVGCSYHYFRKFLKKLFNTKEIAVRFVRPDVGYNGHIEVSETEKESALTTINIFQTEHPDIKNLYWAIVK